MARHEEYVKYGLYAIGAYLAYTKVWPLITNELTTITSHLTTGTNSVIATTAGASAIASEFNPSGLPSSTYFGMSQTSANNVVAGVASSPNINNGLAIYYITSQDSANISLMAPVNTISLTFDQWASYYRQAKGIVLPLQATDVGVNTSEQLSLSQFTVLVNTHYPVPALAGLYGRQVDNRWYGVL